MRTLKSRAPPSSASSSSPRYPSARRCRTRGPRPPVPALSFLLQQEQLWVARAGCEDICVWSLRDLAQPPTRIRLQDCSAVSCLIRVKRQVRQGAPPPHTVCPSGSGPLLALPTRGPVLAGSPVWEGLGFGGASPHPGHGSSSAHLQGAPFPRLSEAVWLMPRFSSADLGGRHRAVAGEIKRENLRD